MTTPHVFGQADQRLDRNTLSFWYPAVQRAGVFHPETRIVEWGLETYDDNSLLCLLDGQTPNGYNEFLDKLDEAVDGVGGYPAFLRTGLGSGKHGWRDTCHITGRDVLADHVAALVMWSEMVDFHGLAVNEWVVRGLLDTAAGFHAFQGMPITAERRYFVRDGELLGWHPYWPPAAFETLDGDWAPDHAQWQTVLDELNGPWPGEVEWLTEQSKRISREIEGAWSIDWLWTDSGHWYCTDMAVAEKSFVWAEYPEAPQGLHTP